MNYNFISVFRALLGTLNFHSSVFKAVRNFVVGCGRFFGTHSYNGYAVRIKQTRVLKILRNGNRTFKRNTFFVFFRIQFCAVSGNGYSFYITGREFFSDSVKFLCGKAVDL